MKALPRFSKAALAFLAATVFFVVFRAIQAPVRHWNHTRQVDAILRTDPFYSAVVAGTPSVREPLRTAMIRAFDFGRREDAFVAGSRLLSPLIPKFVPRASDAAVLSFGRRLVTGLRALAAQDPDDCYRYLFPNAAGPPKRWNATADAEMIRAARELVASAVSSNVRVEQPGTESLAPVYAELRARYGERLALLQQAEVPDVDRELVCRMTTDLYAEIIKLPEREAVGALRHIFAEPQ